MYAAAGSILSLSAFPKPGYVFAGWQLGTGAPDAFVSNVTVTGPLSVLPRFEPAKQVTLVTSPPGLHVLADRQPLLTADHHGLGARHQARDRRHHATGRSGRANLGCLIPGARRRTEFALHRRSHQRSETLTAKFVPGARVAFRHQSGGLKLKIDGRSNCRPIHFIWGRVAFRPMTSTRDGRQTDSAGRRYVFIAVERGSPDAAVISIPQDAAEAGLRWSPISKR